MFIPRQDIDYNITTNDSSDLCAIDLMPMCDALKHCYIVIGALGFTNLVTIILCGVALYITKRKAASKRIKNRYNYYDVE